ncbi:hypothetical protein FOZ60_000524, partial [Perkinsus olseni]
DTGSLNDEDGEVGDEDEGSEWNDESGLSETEDTSESTSSNEDEVHHGAVNKETDEPVSPTEAAARLIPKYFDDLSVLVDWYESVVRMHDGSKPSVEDGRRDRDVFVPITVMLLTTTAGALQVAELIDEFGGTFESYKISLVDNTLIFKDYVDLISFHMPMIGFPFALSNAVYAVLSQRFMQCTMSIEEFTRAICYVLMDHFVSNPWSILCDPQLLIPADSMTVNVHEHLARQVSVASVKAKKSLADHLLGKDCDCYFKSRGKLDVDRVCKDLAVINNWRRAEARGSLVLNGLKMAASCCGLSRVQDTNIYANGKSECHQRLQDECNVDECSERLHGLIDSFEGKRKDALDLSSSNAPSGGNCNIFFVAVRAVLESLTAIINDARKEVMMPPEVYSPYNAIYVWDRPMVLDEGFGLRVFEFDLIGDTESSRVVPAEKNHDEEASSSDNHEAAGYILLCRHEAISINLVDLLNEFRAYNPSSESTTSELHVRVLLTYTLAIAQHMNSNNGRFDSDEGFEF